MSDSNRRLATSADIPVAVEYLIQLVLRWFLWTIAVLVGAGGLACWVTGCSLYVSVPMFVVSAIAALGGWAVKGNRSKLRFDSTGPVVIVPARSEPRKGD